MISYHFDTPSVFHAHSYVWGFRPVLRFPALLLGSRTGPVSSVSVFFALVVFLLSSPVLSFARTGAWSVGRSFAQFCRHGNLIDVALEEILDALECVLLLLADKGDGHSVVVGTGCTSDAVYVVFTVMGHVVVDYQADIIDVNATGISPTFSFIDFKARATSLTLILEDANMMARSGTSSEKRLRMMPSFWFS